MAERQGIRAIEVYQKELRPIEFKEPSSARRPPSQTVSSKLQVIFTNSKPQAALTSWLGHTDHDLLFSLGSADQKKMSKPVENFNEPN